jgi:hypothetical protein
MFFNELRPFTEILARLEPHRKFAIRLFLELRFAQLLCAAQEMSRMLGDAFGRPQ